MSQEYRLQDGKGSTDTITVYCCNYAFKFVENESEKNGEERGPDLPLFLPGRYLPQCHPRCPAQCCTVRPADAQSCCDIFYHAVHALLLCFSVCSL